MENPQKQFVLSLLAYVVQRDVSPKQLCKLANIDLEKLKKKEPYDFTRQQRHDLWRHAIALTNDPLFGLHFGESLQLAALGAVGEIIKSSATVGQGIQIACSLTHLVTDLFTMQVTNTKKTFTIDLLRVGEKNTADEFLARQLADLLMVFTVHELDGLLLEKITPTSVTLPFKAEDNEEYIRVLRSGEVKKGSKYSMTFSSTYWNEPILTANYELQTRLLEKVHSQATNSLKANEDLHHRVRDYILAHTYLGIPSLEEVAANFNVTPRSLQRKLREEGVTFQELTDGIRKTLALHYLQAGNYPLKEISHMLGYNELSAFSRAFKRWTGKAPGNFAP